MIINIWLLLTLFLVFLVVYPYLIYPVILSVLPKKILLAHAFNTNHQPEVALLFCAYNEEVSLPEKINNLIQLKRIWPSLTIYGYSDCSTDNTNEILKSNDGLLIPVIGTKRLGKVGGMQKLVDLAGAEIIIFTDANVLLEPESLPLLINYFQDPEIGCVSGTLHYKGLDSTTATVGGLYWKLEEKIKMLESRSGSMMGADGAIFARRKKNYPNIPLHLVDDMAVSMETVFSGNRCISASNIIAYENAVSSRSEEFKRKIRIACGSYSTYQHQKEELYSMSLLNKFKFLSHKIIRWWGAFYIVLGILSFCMWGFSIGYGIPLSLIVLVLIIILGVAGHCGVQGISVIYEILASIIATGIGIMKAMSGKKYQTWDTSDTR